jgi:hypothetical protein
MVSETCIVEPPDIMRVAIKSLTDLTVPANGTTANETSLIRNPQKI